MAAGNSKDQQEDWRLVTYGVARFGHAIPEMDGSGGEPYRQSRPRSISQRVPKQQKRAQEDETQGENSDCAQWFFSCRLPAPLKQKL
jgi:hypothetical protein